jgi:hypothetical protein
MKSLIKLYIISNLFECTLNSSLISCSIKIKIKAQCQLYDIQAKMKVLYD